MNKNLVDVSKNRQMFLDDFVLERTINTSISLHRPDSKGPVLFADKNFKQKSIQSRSAPQWNSDKNFWEYFYMSLGDNYVYQVRKYHFAIS